MTDIPILFEDQDLIVVNKPPGIVVNKSDTHSLATLQAWLEERLSVQAPVTQAAEWQPLVPSDFNAEFGTPADTFEERHGLVHRLDKDTSGVIVMAKNPGALVALLQQFKRRETEKKYLTLVHGKVQAPQATLSFPIGRSSIDRKVFSVQPDGRLAETKYRVQQRYTRLALETVGEQILENWLRSHPTEKPLTLHQLEKRLSIYQGFSLVECWPKTGRTHQIRVHLAHIRHPLVGDATYVGKKRQSLDPLWCPRQFLHAQQLSLTHPRTGEKLTFSAPLWPDLDLVLSSLVME